LKFLYNKIRHTSSFSSAASSRRELLVSESVLATDASGVLPKLPVMEPGLPGLRDPATIDDTRPKARRAPTIVDWARRLFCRLRVRRLTGVLTLVDDAGGTRRLLSEVRPAPPLHLLIIPHTSISCSFGLIKFHQFEFNKLASVYNHTAYHTAQPSKFLL